MTIDEAITQLEYGIEQMTMELKSGLWAAGSDTELHVKQGIELNQQHIAWLTELKELEAKHWDECRQIAHYDDELSKYQKEMPKIVEYIDYLRSLPVNRWISCKDKMPDDGVNVLIYAGNRMISLAWYDKDMGYFYICDSDYKYNLLDVTHWQPLPEPPKDGDTD